MKFIHLAHWSIRAESIIAVSANPATKEITIYCDNNQQFSIFCDSPEDTCERYQSLAIKLEKNA